MTSLRLGAALAAFASSASAACADPVPAAFAPVAALLGDWAGSGTSDAGPGTGKDSFTLDLQGHVVVRRSHAEYPGKDGKPVVYDALMVVYQEPGSPTLRADYYDNGHVIHYSLAPGSDPNVVRFVSDAKAGMPSFRLTYTVAADGKTLGVKFEVAPPGGGPFSTVAEGTDRRVAAIR
jgi:hypothetical protein